MLTIEEMNTLLYSYPVLGQLREFYQDAIQREGFSFQAVKGQHLFREGDTCHWLFLITSGSLQVVRSTKNGRLINLYEVHAGDTCLMTTSALLGSIPYAAQGIATTDIKGVLISQFGFNQLIDESAQFRHFFFQQCSRQLQLLLKRFDALDLMLDGSLDNSLFWQPPPSGELDSGVFPA